MSKVHARTLETQAVGGELTITNCRFDLINTVSLTIRNSRPTDTLLRVIFQDCSIKSVFAINARSAKLPLQINFKDTIFTGAGAFKAWDKAAHTHIHINALRSDFKNTHQLVWFRTPKYKAALKLFRWHSEESSYTPENDQVSFGYHLDINDAVLVKPI